VSLNNQREITPILKRDKRKSISAVVNKKNIGDFCNVRCKAVTV
jgi:hypothetical protein